MSMTETAGAWSSTHRSAVPYSDAYSGKSRSRISWGAVFAGAVVAVATSLLLSLFGAAMGAGSINVTAASADLSRYGTAAGLWQIINIALSMALGGYVTARLSGTHSHLDGELHGITMWGIAVLLGTVLVAQAVSSVVGVVGQGVGTVASGAASGAIGSASGTVNPQAMIAQLAQSLTSSGDPTTMTREQVSAEITTLVGKSVANGGIADADRNRLTALVAAQSGITQEEASRRVSNMENDVKATLAQAEQKAREAADTVAQGAAIAARVLFTALVIGLLAALVGAWIGTRHKRVLHPVVADGHHEAGYDLRTAYETAAPRSVSVYDETGHLVSQYLRGVSFPVTKQDLLRLARSGNAGPGVLHLIGEMAEGSYANAEEVFRALGMAR